MLQTTKTSLTVIRQHMIIYKMSHITRPLSIRRQNSANMHYFCTEISKITLNLTLADNVLPLPCNNCVNVM